MLALTTYKCIYLFTGWIILYRIGAGCCSIITKRAFQSLQLDNRQQARVFLCPFIIIRGGCFPFVKLVVGFFTLFYKQLI